MINLYSGLAAHLNVLFEQIQVARAVLQAPNEAAPFAEFFGGDAGAFCDPRIIVKKDRREQLPPSLHLGQLLEKGIFLMPRHQFWRDNHGVGACCPGIILQSDRPLGSRDVGIDENSVFLGFTRKNFDGFELRVVIHESKLAGFAHH